MSGPTTAREALIAEILGNLDKLLDRAEKLPATIQAAESKLQGTMQALDAAGDRYRAVITQFTEGATSDLETFSERSVQQWTTKVQASMQEAARVAFRSEALEKAGTLSESLQTAIRKLGGFNPPSRWEVMLACLASAVVSSVLTVALIKYL